MGHLKLALVAACGGLIVASAASAADRPSAGTTSAAGNEKLICRKTLETGSLVRRIKQCFTQAEWDELAEIQRRGNQKVVDGLTERSVGK